MTKASRYWVRYFLTLINRFKLFFLISIIIGGCSFVVLNFIAAKQNTAKEEKTGIIGEYTPSNLPLSITNLISMGLTKIDITGKAVPGIAKSWEIKNDGKTWEFHLNENMKWQDNTPLTSSDINYNFSDATVTKPDKYTIIFNLKTPLSDFSVVLAKPVFKQGLLGNSDWKVNHLTLAGSYIETLTLKDKNSNTKLFKFYPTEDRAKLAYELGEINILENLLDPTPFNSWSTVYTQTFINKKQYVAVFFNTTDEVTGDKDLRQALSYAIDKEKLGSARAIGPISPDSWGYNPSVKPYDLNKDHAKSLLGGKKNLKIKLTTVPDLLPTAEKIAKNWHDIGVETTLQITAFVPDQYQAFLSFYDIPSDPDQYSIWHSTQTGGNITRYKNTRIDKLLEDGRLETDQMKRKSIYFDFQKYLLEDAPAAFLYYPTYYNITRK